ncbi:Alpha-L-fucosidase, partial [human gut metagenome]
GMIGFSQKVDDRTAYSLLCKKCGTTLYYTAVQAENVEKASRLAKLELCAAEDMGADKLLQQHKRWWQQYWGKSSLQLPDETLEQLWYRANYFLAAGSEPGNAPMPLQGVWCADDDQLPPWKGDYHNDLNTQFTYCHYLTANHPEQGKVFLDYLWSLRPQAAKFARAFYGTAGECL